MAGGGKNWRQNQALSEAAWSKPGFAKAAFFAKKSHPARVGLRSTFSPFCRHIFPGRHGGGREKLAAKSSAKRSGMEQARLCKSRFFCKKKPPCKGGAAEYLFRARRSRKGFGLTAKPVSATGFRTCKNSFRFQIQPRGLAHFQRKWQGKISRRAHVYYVSMAASPAFR